VSRRGFRGRASLVRGFPRIRRLARATAVSKSAHNRAPRARISHAYCIAFGAARRRSGGRDAPPGGGRARFEKTGRRAWPRGAVTGRSVEKIWRHRACEHRGGGGAVDLGGDSRTYRRRSPSSIKLTDNGHRFVSSPTAGTVTEWLQRNGARRLRGLEN
jgi:hypothetical protein